MYFDILITPFICPQTEEINLCAVFYEHMQHKKGVRYFKEAIFSLEHAMEVEPIYDIHVALGYIDKAVSHAYHGRNN